MEAPYNAIFCQDFIKHKVLNELKSGDAFIFGDWAMKFNPIYYREKQEQWFGKKGISWHVTLVTYKKNGVLMTLTFVHLFDSCCQDTNIIIGIYDEVFKIISDSLNIKRVSFRSDNAGLFLDIKINFLLSFL